MNDAQIEKTMHANPLSSNNLLFFFLLIPLMGCSSSKQNRKVHINTTKLCDRNLYVETYRTFSSGAFGGDMVTDYLTDSVTYRVYVANFDNSNTAYSYECSDDSLNIYTRRTSGIDNNFKIVETHTFSLKALAKLHNISNKKIDDINNVGLSK